MCQAQIKHHQNWNYVGPLHSNDLFPEGFLDCSNELQTTPWLPCCWALAVTISMQIFHHLVTGICLRAIYHKEPKQTWRFPFAFPALHIPHSYKCYFCRRDKLPSGLFLPHFWAHLGISSPANLFKSLREESHTKYVRVVQILSFCFTQFTFFSLASSWSVDFFFLFVLQWT